MEVEYLETNEAKMDAFSIFIRNGLFFLLAGITLGLINLTGNSIEEYGYQLPIFLYRSQPSNMLYSIGVALLLIGGLYYLIDIKGIENNITKMFIFYGNVSLSIFLI